MLYESFGNCVYNTRVVCSFQAKLCRICKNERKVLRAICQKTSVDSFMEASYLSLTGCCRWRRIYFTLGFEQGSIHVLKRPESTREPLNIVDRDHHGQTKVMLAQSRGLRFTHVATMIHDYSCQIGNNSRPVKGDCVDNHGLLTIVPCGKKT